MGQIDNDVSSGYNSKSVQALEFVQSSISLSHYLSGQTVETACNAKNEKP